ncbi:substrate-binding domain-containing protein [Thermodesulfobacteriota bacterium]
MLRRMTTVFCALALTLLAGTNGMCQERLKMSTTTSTDNSGLLEALLPPFEKMCNVKVDVIAVGTGKALRLGENGDVDVVFVHARGAEDKFINDGFGVNRRDVMYNDFVIIGPADDPAKIQNAKTAAEALALIAKASAAFVSRGDDSGTHKKEKQIWAAAGITPQGDWYQEVGQGMGAVLKIADEKQAYVLADRGTYLAFTKKISLSALCESDPGLYNPYGIMAVNPARYPHAKYVKAMALIGWITSPEGQSIIRKFGKDTFGRPLFIPMAITK